MIRTIQLPDIPALQEIQKQTAAQDPFRIDIDIGELVRTFPEGQLLAEEGGRIVGFALSRRIDGIEALHRASAAGMSAATAPAASGQALVLLACSALPDAQAGNARRGLLEAVKAAAAAIAGVRAVLTVGWCQHGPVGELSGFRAYLGTAIKEGWATEPALRFHIDQGAAVAGFIEHYRPATAPGFGYGVLLQHPVGAQEGAGSDAGPKAAPLEKRIRALTRQYPELVPLSLAGDGPMTFWIHPMSGDVGMYNRLATRFGNGIRMIGIRARGFLTEQSAPVSDMVQMARDYAERIVAVQAQGPYHLAGFSVGGTVAYEVARQLQLQGKTVASLVMVEAPVLSDRDRPLFQSSVRNNLLANANFMLVTLLSMNPTFKQALEQGEMSWEEIQIDESDVAGVSDSGLLARLVDLCLQRDVKLSRKEIAFKLSSMADVHMANLQSIQTYHAEPLPRANEINAFVFRTREGRVTSGILRNPEYIERVQEAHGSLLPLLTAWTALLPGVSTVILDGEDHFDILRSKPGMQKFVGQCLEVFGAAVPVAAQPRAAVADGGAASVTEAVAIIGMSGRFPGAPDVHRFWENLKNGVDSIAEVPADRGWRIDDYFDPRPQTPARSYSKWGGFLDDVDKFDPLFFGIAPREAEVMDPSERIFLQECWRAIEDAGYAASDISGLPWGVFATAKGDYAYHIHKSHETYLAPTDSSGPARVSYLLNLVGPAISVDTACSSTLTAVAYACDSLVLGNCEVALAGGGGIYSTPNFLVSSSQSLLFSPDGLCAPFDHRANGTVMGEAVGVVVLKLLKHALRDGDPIHGVIRGWATNQDGKTNGMTAPSMSSQTRLQSQVYKKFGIDCARIGMVESHGTGTKLGDPIEVQALTASFRESTQATGYCALAAVKGNIGHAFAGAGIASLIKVLLSLKHRQIPPNLNYQKCNPFIKIEGSPFYVNTALKDWQDPGHPRCAAINSFGATGINAHLVVEEWAGAPLGGEPGTAPALILLSAKSADRLDDQARRLLAFVQSRGEGGATLEQLAYTLQVGRNAMEERVALLVRSFDELEQKLAAFLEGQKRIRHLYAGRAVKNPTSELLLNDEDLDKLADAWIASRQYEKLLRLWVNGYAIAWRRLYSAGAPRRVSLPTYPFAGERYWYTPAAPDVGQAGQHAPQARGSIHPLLHANTSDLTAQKYSSSFSGREFFLAGHVVQGQPVLPGVAYLEMARAALRNASGGPDAAAQIRLTHVVWARPISVIGDAVEVHLTLTPAAEGGMAFEIFTNGDAGQPHVVHSRGAVELIEALPEVHHDIGARMAGCGIRSLSHEQCYDIFDAVGVVYGPGHRVIQRLMVGRGEALAELYLPDDMVRTLNDFVLHPGLVDAALQACIGVLLEAADEGAAPGEPKLLLPFALRELEVRGPCTQTMWAVVSRDGAGDASDQIGMNIDLCDQDGRIQARLTGFTARVFAGHHAPSPLPAGEGSVLLTPRWIAAPIRAGQAAAPFDAHVVLLCDVGPGASGLELPPGTEVHRLSSSATGIGERFTEHAVEALRIVQELIRRAGHPRLLVQIVARHDGVDLLQQGLIGLLQTASLEQPTLCGQFIGVAGDEDGPALARLITENAGAPQDRRVRFSHGERRILAWEEEGGAGAAPALPWQDHGVYLFTGGAGALGLALARDAAGQAREPVLVLVGRSELTAAQAQAIAELAATGARVAYRQADLAIAGEADALLAAVRSDHGAVHGIVHLAGITRDNFIIAKTAEDVHAVLAPKVAGLINLDQASRDDALAFFVLFSSLAAVTGNIGQADYSMGNAFMDAYAEYRNGLAAGGQRQGKTISVNWPLWAQGGMRPAGGQHPATSRGLTPMPSSTGIGILGRALTVQSDQLVVMHGDVARLRTQIRPDQGQGQGQKGRPAQPDRAGDNAAAQQESLAAPARPGERPPLDKTLELIKQTLASALKMPEHTIDPDAPLENYGVDSILSMELTTLLEKRFGQLPKTLFFEYLNIRDLAGYFIREHGAALAGLFPAEQAGTAPAQPAPPRAPQQRAPRPQARPGPGAQNTRLMAAPGSRRQPPAPPPATNEIAIIGLAGRYPGAGDMEQFWANLKSARDSITEVPHSRWDSARYFDRTPHTPGKSYCRWGGFIDDVDQFDPLFFNIAPREASLVDPQERLFLELSWELMESAGYTRSALSKQFAGQVGVFVGAMYQQYHSMKSDPTTEAVLSLASYSSIANRVSHFLGLHGPSIALDTMCSSSFTAIHLACESLAKGECQMAIAGGVNLSIHPKKYVGLAQARIIGSSPASRSFSNGDGYLPAEGVGAVLLKPLHLAERDGDVICAVIKGSSINHGGRTNSFGVPNPNAQAQLIEASFAKAGIDPDTIGYVEAAANGSPLGDAIEMAALAQVFGSSPGRRQACPIGSVKSNIGHAEAASGMSQLSKVILQMQHGQIVPSPDIDQLNPNIRFEDSSFYLAQELTPWTRRRVDIDGESREVPRRAMINAFGAGGSNAHLLVEEYVSGRSARPRPGLGDPRQVVVLSAKSAASLQAMAQRLRDFLQTHPVLAVADLAYTLQIGREAMDCRLSLVAADGGEVLRGLDKFLSGTKDTQGDAARVPMFVGQNEDGQALRELFFGSIGENLSTVLMQERHPEKLALYWAYGGTVDWALLHQGEDVRRVVLPTYAFERKRYWVDTREDDSEPEGARPHGHDGQPADITATLAELIGIGVDQLRLTRPLVEYGFDSIHMMQLLGQLQSRGDAAIHAEELMACRTPQELIALVERRSAHDLAAAAGLQRAMRAGPGLATSRHAFPELIRLNRHTAGTPVFWFHAGMGGVEAYQAIAQRSARPFFGIQARGWGTGRAPLHGLQAMAAYYAHIICHVWPEGPCDLGGYSLGGVLAYEVTRQLQELGRTVTSIVMLDSPDGNALRHSSISSKTHLLRALNTQLSSLIGADLADLDKVLIHRDEADPGAGDEAYLRALLDNGKIRRLNKPADKLHDQIIQHLRVQRAYEADQAVLAPLSRPGEVSCYFFRNRSGEFFGLLEPYFLAGDDEGDMTVENYWEEWTALLPKLTIIDVDSSSHMSLLAEERSFQPIASLCASLYSSHHARHRAGDPEPDGRTENAVADGEVPSMN